MEMNMLDLWAETRREAHVRPIEHNIIPSYEITNEVEISAQTLGDSCVRYFFPSARTLQKTVRAGRFKKRSIAYLTFAADSEVTLHKLVQKEMKAIFQLQYVQVLPLCSFHLSISLEACERSQVRGRHARI
ncbi:hypothetical protein BDV93DRAFT_228060 [Ceratobasidium sp. AG-I]|nr:hypothetical protein BDV93DRAFT_228060 [Ceratobasidium sp. AG-I]